MFNDDDAAASTRVLKLTVTSYPSSNDPAIQVLAEFLLLEGVVAASVVTALEPVFNAGNWTIDAASVETTTVSRESVPNS